MWEAPVQVDGSSYWADVLKKLSHAPAVKYACVVCDLHRGYDNQLYEVPPSLLHSDQL